MEDNPKRQFRFGAIIHQDYQQLAMLLPDLEDRLNQRINLKDYTDRVKRIYFTPMMMPDSLEVQEEAYQFDEKEQTVFFKVKLKMDPLAQMSKQDFEALVGKSLRENLDKLAVFPGTFGEAIRRVISSSD